MRRALWNASSAPVLGSKRAKSETMIIRRNILKVWKLARRRNILTCMFWTSPSVPGLLLLTPFLSSDTPSRSEVHEDSGAVVSFLSIREQHSVERLSQSNFFFFLFFVLFLHWFWWRKKTNDGFVFTVTDLLLYLWMLFTLNKMNVTKQMSPSEGMETSRNISFCTSWKIEGWRGGKKEMISKGKVELTLNAHFQSVSKA